MKISLITVTVITSVFIFCHTSSLRTAITKQTIIKANPFKKKNREDKPNGPEKVLRMEYLMTRDPQLNIIPYERLSVAKKRSEEITNSQMSHRTSSQLRTTSLTWNERGPNNVGGRTRAVLVDKNDATGNTVFAGSVGGGLWRTTNFKSATPSWTSINDFFASIAISCIKQSPTNPLIMYFGTGEGWGNADALRGLGIWKSTNGGLSWSQLSSTTGLEYVLDLEFDNNGYVYAATRTSVAGLRGIIRSTDGGNSWTQVLTDPSGATSRGTDLERANNGDLYATMGIFQTGKIFRAPSNGINTGISGSWNNITPSHITTNNFQRTEIAIAPNSSRIYAIAQHPTSYGVGAMYRSDNYGATWTTLPDASWCDYGSTTTTTDIGRGQAWYDLIMAVDPSNADNILAGGVVVVKSLNAGGLWTQMTRWTSSATCSVSPIIHADIHEIQFLNSNEIIIATDGGIYFSTDGGLTFSAKNSSYNVTQYYAAAIDPTLGSNRMIAGAQDNGSHLFSSFGINAVTDLSGGDGAYCFIDQTNPNVWITSSQYSNYYIFRNNNYVASISTSGGRFINPAEYDDVNNVLYYAQGDGQYGRGFNIESGTVSFNSIDFSSSMGPDRQVSTIKVDPNDPTTVWLGCSSSEITGGSVTPILLKVIRANGPAAGSPYLQPAATVFTGPSLPAGSFISSIDIDASNSNHMLLTVSNYGVASVWESMNGGTTWTSLDNNGVNLPDMPIRWGMFLPAGYHIGPGETTNGIMLATELGTWSTLASNGTSTAWSINNSGMANVRVDMLKLRKSDKTILAATHGRGLFTAVVPTVLPVTLSDFKGHARQDENVLEWSTSLEFNLKLFEVQKSMNGTDYFPIGNVNSKRNGITSSNYTFIDKQVGENNYYRLRMIEEDGKSTLSKVVVLKQSSESMQSMMVLNNPVSDHLSLRFANPANEIYLQLFDMNGIILSERKYNNINGILKWQLNQNIKRGTYVLRAYADGKLFTEKIIKN